MTTQTKKSASKAPKKAAKKTGAGSKEKPKKKSGLKSIDALGLVVILIGVLGALVAIQESDNKETTPKKHKDGKSEKPRKRVAKS